MNTKKFFKSALCGIMSAVMLGSISVYAGGYGMGDELKYGNTTGTYTLRLIREMPYNIFIETLTNNVDDKDDDPYYNNTKDSSKEIYDDVKKMVGVMDGVNKLSKYLSKDEDGNTWVTVYKFVSSDSSEVKKEDVEKIEKAVSDVLFFDKYELTFPDKLIEINSNNYVGYIKLKMKFEVDDNNSYNDEYVKYMIEKEGIEMNYAKIFYALEQADFIYNDLTGDTNADAEVNVRDAAFIAQKLAARKYMEIPGIADFNGDEKVDVRDAAAIARYLANSFK